MDKKEVSGKVISNLIKQDGRETAIIAADLGITKQALGQFKNGTRYPSPKFITAWKKRFEVDIEVLINNELKNKSNNTTEIDRVIMQLQNAYDNNLKEIKGSMKETIAALEDTNKYLKQTIDKLIVEKKELLKRIPHSQKTQ
jgi:transcriptional regulator with XRE-family HTH domain